MFNVYYWLDLMQSTLTFGQLFCGLISERHIFNPRSLQGEEWSACTNQKGKVDVAQASFYHIPCRTEQWRLSYRLTAMQNSSNTMQCQLSTDIKLYQAVLNHWSGTAISQHSLFKSVFIQGKKNNHKMMMMVMTISFTDELYKSLKSVTTSSLSYYYVTPNSHIIQMTDTA